METFKNVWITIGTIAFVLMLALGIGMCTNSFRAKVLDIMNAVPEQQLTETQEENAQLLTELTECQTSLRLLNLQKTTLEQTISSLQTSNNENEELIAEYENELDEINAEMINLNARITNITNTVNGATVSYVGTSYEITYAKYDSNNNFMGHNTINDNNGQNMRFRGEGVINSLTYEYLPFANDFLNTDPSTSIRDIYINEIEIYEFTIDSFSRESNCCDTSYMVSSSASFEFKIILNNEVVSSDDINSLIDVNALYIMSNAINFTINSNDIVSSTIYTINLTQV